MVHLILLKANPFFDAYTESDLLGKLIFLALIVISIVSWSVLLYKLWITRRIRRESFAFKKIFNNSRETPLSITAPHTSNAECPNAFYILYEVLKSKTQEILEKSPSLSAQDTPLLEAHAGTTISSLTKYLEKHVYILSTVVTLAPFLGLLGTVYGILVTFTNLQPNGMAGSNQAVLSGLSLALTTTVIGLIDAIPALIGYNYLKNQIADFDAEMDRFATDVLSTFELHYRR